MKKTVFICPYFGTLPKHTQIWLNTCAANKNFFWLLLTDDKTAYDYPENVIVEYTTMSELRDRFQKKFDFTLSLPDIKKLGDYKPLYGYLFEDEIKDYDAWGHIDVSDEVYGDLSAFITDELLEKYDKLMLFGHMSVYKNTPEVNRRFMLPNGTERSYKDIFSSGTFYNFEEVAKGSIADVYRKNGFEIGRLDYKIADLRCLKFQFEFGVWSDDITKYTVRTDRKPCVFARENGRIFCYYLNNKQVEKEEFMYVHFKRRKMNIDIDQNETNYLITPSGFAPMTEITPELIKKQNRYKGIYPVYFQEKKRSLLNRFKK